MHSSLVILAAILFLCKLEGQNVKIIFGIRHFWTQHTQIDLKSHRYCSFQHVWYAQVNIICFSKQYLNESEYHVDIQKINFKLKVWKKRTDMYVPIHGNLNLNFDFWLYNLEWRTYIYIYIYIYSAQHIRYYFQAFRPFKSGRIRQNFKLIAYSTTNQYLMGINLAP